MNLYSDLLNSFHITEDEVLNFKDNHPGFCNIQASQISFLLIIQLAVASKYRIFNSFSVTDVIQQLEGVGRNGSAKGEETFKHLPLKGFWKVHFFDARFMIKNLINHWGLELNESPKLDALCSRVAIEEQNNPSKHGWQGRLAHEMTINGYDERARKKKLTGEWIIFSKYKGVNYYLCVAEHSKSKDDDEKIYSTLKKFCLNEFTFLF